MVPELANLLRQCVAQTLEERVAVAFSGGLDSTLIASVARNDAATELFSCGISECDDLRYAQQVAALLNLPLNKAIVTEAEVIETYNECRRLVPEDFLKVELLVPVYKTAEAALKAHHEILLFGCGTEELFVGYEKYYLCAEEGKNLAATLREEFRNLKNREISWINRICRNFGIEARYPFYNNELERFVRSLPLEALMDNREKKKGLLREAGKLLGVPEPALQRKKTAMQYGSGIHKILLKCVKAGVIS